MRVFLLYLSVSLAARACVSLMARPPLGKPKGDDICKRLSVGVGGCGLAPIYYERGAPVPSYLTELRPFLRDSTIRDSFHLVPIIVLRLSLFSLARRACHARA